MYKAQQEQSDVAQDVQWVQQELEKNRRLISSLNQEQPQQAEVQPMR